MYLASSSNDLRHYHYADDDYFYSLGISMFYDLGITLLLLSPSAHHNLELSLVQRHQTEVEAREEAAETEEDTEENHTGPGW